MMKNLLTLVLLLTFSGAFAMDNHGSHNHIEHNHTKFDNQSDMTDVNNKMYDAFVANLIDAQVAIIDVNGMVCDFCARGIEKTFYEDKLVKKVNVSLETGKVLIAYTNTKNIDVEELRIYFYQMVKPRPKLQSKKYYKLCLKAKNQTN